MPRPWCWLQLESCVHKSTWRSVPFPLHLYTETLRYKMCFSHIPGLDSIASHWQAKKLLFESPVPWESGAGVVGGWRQTCCLVWDFCYGYRENGAKLMNEAIRSQTGMGSASTSWQLWEVPSAPAWLHPAPSISTFWQDLVISWFLQHLQSSAYVGSRFCRQIRAGEVYGGVDAGPLNEENEDSDCTSSIKDLERQPKKPYM